MMPLRALALAFLAMVVLAPAASADPIFGEPLDDVGDEVERRAGHARWLAAWGTYRAGLLVQECVEGTEVSPGYTRICSPDYYWCPDAYRWFVGQCMW